MIFLRVKHVFRQSPKRIKVHFPEKETPVAVIAIGGKHERS